MKLKIFNKIKKKEKKVNRIKIIKNNLVKKLQNKHIL